VQIYMKKSKGTAKSAYPKTENRWTGDVWCIKYGQEEQWLIFTYHEHEECKNSLPNDIPLLDT